jgi:1-deoxy-D-xylulose-5-phosphate reductoisomerase
MRRRKVVLLGATGSIGRTTLSVLRDHPDVFELVGVSANANGEDLAHIVHEFHVPHACLIQENVVADFPESTVIHSGERGLLELCDCDADIFVVAVVGMAALRPLQRLLKRPTVVALANKEALVSAGAILTTAAAEHGTTIVPLDSEHSAVFQCLFGSRRSVRRVVLTASGGPFYTLPSDKFDAISPAEALRHPNFSMGTKITVDSATMANKGLELMEARWLFSLHPEQLEVVIHPEQKVHALVEFEDSSVLAQITPPSMYFPIHYGLFFPNGHPCSLPTVDFRSAQTWHFEVDGLEKFPCLGLARECLAVDGTWSTVFNAANEVAVGQFLSHKIRYTDIARRIESAMHRFPNFVPHTIDDVLSVDADVRLYCEEMIKR